MKSDGQVVENTVPYFEALGEPRRAIPTVAVFEREQGASCLRCGEETHLVVYGSVITIDGISHVAGGGPMCRSCYRGMEIERVPSSDGIERFYFHRR